MFRSAHVSFCLLFLTALWSIPGTAQVIAQYGFEDSTAQGWVSFNNASTPVASTAAAHTGTQSLLTTTNSTGGCSGPSLTLTNLVPGATYTITAFVQLTAGETATAANFTVMRSDPGCSGGTCFDTVGTFQVPVSDSGWAQIGGTYTVSTTATSLVLYAQLVGPTSTQSFYLDDVVITQISGPPGGPQDNSGISTNFEDGALDGWSSRAGSVVANTTADAHGGTHSLLTTNRVAAFDGPQISVSNKMYPGSVYNVSGWVMLQPTDGTNHTINVSLQTTLNGNTSYPGVSGYPGVTVPADGNWHQISVMGYNMANSYDQGMATLYLQTVAASPDLVSFYVDDFQLSYVPPPT